MSHPFALLDDPLEQAKVDLQEFVQSVQSLKGDALERADFLLLYEKYKRIYSQYQSFSDADINAHFEPQQIQMIEVLALGERADARFDDLVRHISSDAAHTAIAVANFVKTRSGFDLAHNAKSLSYTDEELVQFFGSLLGVRIAKECVGQLASERLGSIIGYALSGKCTQDLQEFASLQKNHPELTLVTFLKQKIAQSDHDLLVTGESIHGTPFFHAFVDETQGAPAGAVRSHHRADHCFVLHAQKDAQGNALSRGRIVVGLSTAATDLSAQGNSFFKTVEATRALCAQKTYAGEPNPYYGYEVEPFYFIAGRFVANETQHTQTQNQIGRDFLKPFLDATGKPTAPLNTLGQMPFFSLIGNASNATQCASLLQYNCFIAGTDTFDIYQTQQKVLQTASSEEAPKALLTAFLPQIAQKLTQNIDTLMAHNTSFENAGKGQLELLLQDMVSISSSLVRTFAPVIDASTHEAHLLPLAHKLQQLHTHWKTTGDYEHGAQLDALRQSARYLKDAHLVLEDAQEFAKTFTQSAKWDMTKEAYLSAQKKQTHRDLSNTTLHEKDAQMVVQTGDYLLTLAKSQRVSSTPLHFFDTYLSAVQERLTKCTPMENLLDEMGLKENSFYQYTTHAIGALKSQGAYDLADWISNSRHLVSTEPYSEALTLKRNAQLLSLCDAKQKQAHYLSTYAPKVQHKM